MLRFQFFETVNHCCQRNGLVNTVSTTAKATVCTPVAFAQFLMLNPIPRYNKERARLLHRICRGLVKSQERGLSLWKAAQHVLRRWKGREFESCPGKRLEISMTMLYESFKKWKANPRPEVFNLNYRRKPAEYGPLPLRLLEICKNHDEITSINAALRALNTQERLNVKQRTGHRFLSPQQRAHVKPLFKARVREKEALRRLNAYLACQATTQKNA